MVARIRSRYSLSVIALFALAMAMVASGRAQEQATLDTGSGSRIENPAADPSAQPATNPTAVDPGAVNPGAVNPGATNADDTPEDRQSDLAVKIFPSLLELGLDVVPGDDQAQSVLATVNGLRRQDKQPPFAALDDDVAAYVDQKVAAYRTERTLTIRIQGALDALGLEPGPIDGIYGPLTTEGVRRYQRSVGLPPTGALTAEQVDALEMQSIDKILRPSVAKATPEAKAPAQPKSPANDPGNDPGAVVATPAKAPEIDPDLLDYIGR